MRRYLLLSLFALCSALAVGAQADSDWFWDKPIASIQWDGVKNTDIRQLQSLVKDYIGKSFTDALWTELQDKLYALDWFDQIDPIAVPEDASRSRVVIKFSVKEKPTVQSIRVSGNSGLRTGEILDAASVKAGEIFNETKAASDDVEIKMKYAEKGYPDAAVTHEVQPAEDPSFLVLTYRIVEGTQVAVQSIRFTGNDSISESLLKGQVTLKEAALFQSGVFQEAKLEESRQAVVDFYRTRGFVDARIADVLKTYEKDRKTGKSWLVITFVVVEGRKWNFGGVTFAGNRVFGTDKLAALITLKPGAVLNYKKLLQDKQRVDDLYYENGYIFNTLSMKEIRDEKQMSIAYAVDIVERDRAHIESLAFKGNKKTKLSVMERELPLEVGDIFSKAKIIEGLRNLYNLQYFSTVEPEIYPGADENLMDLVIGVEEQSTADIQFGVTLNGIGLASTFPLSGFVKWNDRNLGGRGQRLQAELNASPSEQSLSLTFGEPWLFAKRISGNVSLSLAHKTSKTGQDVLDPVFSDKDVPDPFTGLGSGTGLWNGTLSSIPDEYLMPYDDWSMSLGFSGSYSFRTAVGDLGLGGGVSSSLGMKDFDEDKYRPYEAGMRAVNGQWLLGNTIFGRVYLNDLDFWYNPTKGFFASQRLTLKGIIPGELQHYMKSETKAEGYLTLFQIPITEKWKFKWVLGAHAGFTTLFAQPGRSAPEVTDDYVSLDGTFNARGWKDLYSMDGLGFLEAGLEIRMPVVDQAVWLDLFFDAGAMRTKDGLVDMTPTDPAVTSPGTGFGGLGWPNMAFSVGAGLRFVIPQFPFRFYFAKRFVTDGASVTWKTAASSFDFVLSITQPLY